MYSRYIRLSSILDGSTTFLGVLSISIRNSKTSQKVILAEDLNALSETWGATHTYLREHLLLDLLTANGLVVLDVGNQPTFHSAEQESHVDITICSESLASIVNHWHVITDEENLSDHFCLEYSLTMHAGPPQTPIRQRFRLRNPEAQKGCIDSFIKEHDSSSSPTELQVMMLRACALANTLAVHPKRKRPIEPKDWWNAFIDRGNEDVTQGLLGHFRDCRSNFWREPRKNPAIEKNSIISRLFTQHAKFVRTPYEKITSRDIIPVITTEEVPYIADKIKTGKAPGPDGILA